MEQLLNLVIVLTPGSCGAAVLTTLLKVVEARVLGQSEFLVIFLFSSVGVDSVSTTHQRWLKNRLLAFRNGRISARCACLVPGQTSRWRRAPSGRSGEGRT